MPDLKLIALDADDLNVMSAHLQDAVLRVRDMTYLPHEKRFAAVANRFDWTTAGASPKQAGERRSAGLRFDHVQGVKVHQIDLQDKSAVLALLAVTFAPAAGDKAPGGDVTLTFSGGAAIRLTVDVLEAELRDLGAAWAAKSVPQHPTGSLSDGDEGR